MSQLVEHHIHYEKIDGYDETVMMTNADHQTLHRRLRKEGKCNVPAKELNKISTAAQERTTKRLEYKQAYGQKEEVMTKCREYGQSDSGRIKRKEYEKNRKAKHFTQRMGVNVALNEIIRYNSLTGNVGYTTYFGGINNHKLPVIDIN